MKGIVRSLISKVFHTILTLFAILAVCGSFRPVFAGTEYTNSATVEDSEIGPRWMVLGAAIVLPIVQGGQPPDTPADTGPNGGGSGSGGSTGGGG